MEQCMLRGTRKLCTGLGLGIYCILPYTPFPEGSGRRSCRCTNISNGQMGMVQADIGWWAGVLGTDVQKIQWVALDQSQCSTEPYGRASPGILPKIRALSETKDIRAKRSGATTEGKTS
jgi:hypothetical protein